MGLLRYQIRQFKFYFKEVHTYIISILFLYKTIFLSFFFLSRAESGHHLGLEWLRSLASMWSRHWIEKDATMIVINIKKNICYPKYMSSFHMIETCYISSYITASDYKVFTRLESLFPIL